MAKIFDGKKLSEKILDNLRVKIKKNRLKLKLAVILVGENPISKIFIREKEKAARGIGINFQLFKISSKVNKIELQNQVEKITKEKDNSGVIIQLPLPNRINSQEFLDLIPCQKDVDVLSEASIGRFYGGSLPIYPPTVGGIRKLLKEYKIGLKRKNVVVVGTGKLVGRPLVLWLLREKTSFSVVNKFTKEISFFTKKADIVISGVGKENVIRENMIKKGAIVIDVGSSHKKGKLRGDVDFKGVSKKAAYISPVPGGVGPMTVACLLENLVKLATK